MIQTDLPDNLWPNISTVWLMFQMHRILQGGNVPPASNSRMPPLSHEPAGFYNDHSATVDIPLESTKVHVLPLWNLVFNKICCLRNINCTRFPFEVFFERPCGMLLVD
jgi:hypothetical protein